MASEDNQAKTQIYLSANKFFGLINYQNVQEIRLNEENKVTGSFHHRAKIDENNFVTFTDREIFEV